MDKECFENAKAELIEAEKRKRAARQPVMTVGDYGQMKRVQLPGTIIGFEAKSNEGCGPTYWLHILLSRPSPYINERMLTVDFPIQKEDLPLSINDLFKKEITLTLEIPDYD